MDISGHRRAFFTITHPSLCTTTTTTGTLARCLKYHIYCNTLSGGALKVDNRKVKGSTLFPSGLSQRSRDSLGGCCTRRGLTSCGAVSSHRAPLFPRSKPSTTGVLRNPPPAACTSSGSPNRSCRPTRRRCSSRRRPSASPSWRVTRWPTWWASLPPRPPMSPCGLKSQVRPCPSCVRPVFFFPLLRNALVHARG